MRKLYSLLFVLFLSLGPPAQARMYQWVDSASGNVRLSGEPPFWYRSAEPGPRILVFDNGRLVDDTAVVVSPEQRKALRESAFLEMDLRRDQDAVKKLERAARREARRREEARLQESAQAAPQAGAENQAAAEQKAQAPSGALDGGMVEQLKALISAWDRQSNPEVDR